MKPPANQTHPMLAGRLVMIGDRLKAVLPDDEAHEFFDENDDPIPQPFVVGSIHWDSSMVDAHGNYTLRDDPDAIRPNGWVVQPVDGPLDSFEWPVTECTRAELTGAESWPDNSWAIRGDGRLIKCQNRITFEGMPNPEMDGPHWQIYDPETGKNDYVPLDVVNAEYRLIDPAAVARIFGNVDRVDRNRVWPEWLTPQYGEIHTAFENEMKRALDHCYASADGAGMAWTMGGLFSVSASNIMGLLKRCGCPPPAVAAGLRPLDMPIEYEGVDVDWELIELLGKLEDGRECHIDGDRNCVTHMIMLGAGEACPHQRAREIIADMGTGD